MRVKAKSHNDHIGGAVCDPIQRRVERFQKDVVIGATRQRQVEIGAKAKVFAALTRMSPEEQVEPSDISTCAWSSRPWPDPPQSNGHAKRIFVLPQIMPEQNQEDG